MEETSRRTIIRMRGIYKRFYIGAPNELEILHGIDLDVQEGEFLSIVGPSGSGKSTLMNVIGVLDRPTEGTYDLDGTVVSQARDDELSSIRNRKIGFVFQNFNLISRTNAQKNVELPMMYAGVPAGKRSARAMANDPAIILADEPTGALDSKTGRLVMDLFHQLNREQGKTIVLITHNQELALETDRFVTMRDGRLYVGDTGEEVRYGDR